MRPLATSAAATRMASSWPMVSFRWLNSSYWVIMPSKVNRQPSKMSMGTKPSALPDIAPTVLTMLGVPVPERMQGRVLSELFADAEAM